MPGRSNVCMPAVWNGKWVLLIDVFFSILSSINAGFCLVCITKFSRMRQDIKIHVTSLVRDVFETRQLLASYGIDNSALPYLVGKGNLYQEHLDWVHDLPLPVVGAALSHICRSSRLGRTRAYKLVWKMLTGYGLFSEGEDDDRYLGTAGVTSRASWADDESDQLPFEESILSG